MSRHLEINQDINHLVDKKSKQLVHKEFLITQHGKTRVRGAEPFSETTAEALLPKHLKKKGRVAQVYFLVDRMRFAKKTGREYLSYREIKQFLRFPKHQNVFMLYIVEEKQGRRSYETFSCLHASDVSAIKDILSSTRTDPNRLLQQVIPTRMLTISSSSSSEYYLESRPGSVISTYTAPVHSTEIFQPMETTQYVTPVQTTEYLEPVRTTQYIQPVETTRYIDPGVGTQYLQHTDSMRYVTPSETSEYIRPVERTRYIQSSRFSEAEPQTTTRYMKRTNSVQYVPPSETSEYIRPVERTRYIQSTRFAEPERVSYVYPSEAESLVIQERPPSISHVVASRHSSTMTDSSQPRSEYINGQYQQTQVQERGPVYMYVLRSNNDEPNVVREVYTK